MNEILNIQYHTKRLIIKALNKHQKIVAAASALGKSPKWLSVRIQLLKLKKEKDQWVKG